nr:reverse transcriptase domain-containing protein [Tanacetum cinerariifolium]
MAYALVDVYGEELILRDGDEQLSFHVDSTSKHPHKHGNESVNMINFIDITCKDRFSEVLKFKKSNHPSSGSATSLFDFSPSLTPFETSDSLLKEFKKKYLLNQDPSTESDIKIIDPILEKFTDEPALDYSPPSGDDDDDDDDLFDLNSDNDEWKKLLYGDCYKDIDFEKDKNKDSKIKLLVDEANIVEPNDLLTQLLDNDSTLPEESSELSEIASLSSSPFRNNDKVFNPGIHILGGTQIFNDESKDKDLILEEHKFLSISSDQELLFFVELTAIKTLLLFSSENKDEVFNPEILISKEVHSFILRLSHRTYNTFKIINIHPNIFNEAQVKAVEEICVTCRATGNYNKGNLGYRPQGVANQMRPPGSGTLPGNTIANPKGELKAITTRTRLVTDGPTVSNPPKSINPEEDECVEETYTDPDHAEYTIKVPPPPPVQKPKPLIQRNFVLHTRDSLPLHIPELKCKALADLGASINLMPLSVWKKLGLPDLIPTRMTLELANHAICTPDGIARDVFVPVGKFTFPADFVIVDYESDPRVPLILGRPFLRTTRALIDVHGEEMILRDGDERLTLNMKHETTSYSNHPRRESVNLINIFNLSSEDCLEDLVSHKQSGHPTFSLHKEIASPEVIHEFYDLKGCTFLSKELLDIDSFNDIHPYYDDDPLSGSTTYSANSLLEVFADELALISYPPDYDDNHTCDIESDIREIEFLLSQGENSDFKDSIDQSDLTNRDDLFVDPTPEMFTDKQPPDYSFPPRCDVYPDDFLEIESDANNFDDDSFDSEGEKIKEDDVLPSPDNEDKVFNPGILIHDKSVKIITRFAQEKKLEVSFASLVFEDFDPPIYELLVFKEVPNSMRLLPFSFENEEKVFKPGIYTFKMLHCCFLSELSHPGSHVFKVNMIFLSLMKIFHVQSGKNTPLLDVLMFYFYPP